MNKYEPHNHDATIRPAILHNMIYELKNEVNGLLGDIAKYQSEIKQLRDALGSHLEDG